MSAVLSALSSKFGDAMGVQLEPVFQGLDPILHVDHH